MRILVISDSHGSNRAIRSVLETNKGISAILHLGDGERDLDGFSSIFGDMPVFRVSGNCDYASLEPEMRLEIIGGKRIFMTHGHLFGVKHDTSHLLTRASELRADIILYGHTHIPVTSYVEGVHILNPGSLRMGSYGAIDIVNQGILCSNLNLVY